MELVTNILLLAVGFVLLIKGADFFVDGSSGIARLLKIPGFVIGLTIVAMGTSAPEAAVSITASAQGANDIAISNIVGSNIFNILFILGLSSVISPLSVAADAVINAVILLAITGAVYVPCLVKKGMGRILGAVCVAGYCIYTAYLLITTI